MFNIGPLELMLILIVALVVVGPKRLPEVGRTIGKSLREFRKAQDEVKRSFDFNLDLDDDEPEPSRARHSENLPRHVEPAVEADQFPARHVETGSGVDPHPARHVETLAEADELPTERFDGFEEPDDAPLVLDGHATPPEPETVPEDEEPEYRRPSTSASGDLPPAPPPAAEPE
jgi:Tat protein translocase TatB subunit